MADTPRSSIAGAKKEPKDSIVDFVGSIIGIVVACQAADGCWRELAVFAGVFVIYLVLVGLLKRVWVRRDLLVPFFGGMIAIIVARRAADGFWRELAVFAA